MACGPYFRGYFFVDDIGTHSRASIRDIFPNRPDFLWDDDVGKSPAQRAAS